MLRKDGQTAQKIDLESSVYSRCWPTNLVSLSASAKLIANVVDDQSILRRW